MSEPYRFVPRWQASCSGGPFENAFRVFPTNAQTRRSCVEKHGSLAYVICGRNARRTWHSHGTFGHHGPPPIAGRVGCGKAGPRSRFRGPGVLVTLRSPLPRSPCLPRSPDLPTTVRYQPVTRCLLQLVAISAAGHRLVAVDPVAARAVWGSRLRWSARVKPFFPPARSLVKPLVALTNRPEPRNPILRMVVYRRTLTTTERR